MNEASPRLAWQTPHLDELSVSFDTAFSGASGADGSTGEKIPT